MRSTASLSRTGNRGFVLIVTLAVLAVLALLGITFVTLQSVDREVSAGYLNDSRALAAAESGVQFVTSSLRTLTESSEGLFPTTGSQIQWIYKDDVTVPVEDSQKPSFAQGQAIRINGKTVDYSGATLVGDFGTYGNQYSVKVVDTSSQIYVNDSGNLFLTRILNNLGTEVGAGSDLGDKIVVGRPARGYRTKHDLISVLGKTTYDKVKEYITVHAWVDTKVVNPVPLSAEEEDASYPVRFNRPVAVAHSHSSSEALADRKKHVYRLGHGVDLTGAVNASVLRFASTSTAAERAVYGLDELHPQWIENASRAPININTASRPVLMALLKGMSGFAVVPGTSALPSFDLTGGVQLSYNVNSGAVSGHAGQLGSLTRITLTDAEAAAIADKIIASRAVAPGAGAKPWEGPIKTWEQFYNVCDDLVTTGVLADANRFVAESKADMLKANFNPNTHLNELNPDAPLALRIDKTDMVAMSTEFCFVPTGYFEIESVGRILKPLGSDSVLTASDNVEVARKKVYSVVHLYDLVRHTTQKDFAGDPAVAASLPAISNSSAVSYFTTTGRSLQTGPGPEVGGEPAGTDYSGYLILGNIGGTSGVTPIAPGEVRANPVCSAHTATELLHSHFQHTAGLNYHKGASTDATLRQTLSRRYDYGSGPVGGNGMATPAQQAFILSQGKPVVASTTYSTYVAGRAVDGNLGTAWISGANVPQWLYVDLGSVQPIEQVRVWAGRGGPTEVTGYNIDVSVDAVTWTTVVSASNNGMQATVSDVSTSGRYVRLNATSQTLNGWIVVYEFGVFGPGTIAAGGGNPSATKTVPEDFYYNHATATSNVTEQLHGPYSLYDYYDPSVPAGKKLHEYRLGRSFTGSAAAGYYYAPSNHRIDGMYSERHAALTYDSVSLNLGKFPYYGAVSYWIKPSFYPESTNQPRTFFSLSRMHDYNTGKWSPTPLAHHYLPNVNSVPTSNTPFYTYNPSMAFPVRSLAFGWGFYSDTGYGLTSSDQLAGGAVSSTQNSRPTVAETGMAYNSLTDVSTERSSNRLKANRWVHMILTWDAFGGFTGSGTTADINNAWEIYANGAPAGTTKFKDPTTNFTTTAHAKASPNKPQTVFNAANVTARPTSSFLMYCGGGRSWSPPPPPPPPAKIIVEINDDPTSITVNERLTGSIWSSSRSINGQLISAPGFYGSGFSVVTSRNVAFTDPAGRGMWAAGGWNPSDSLFFTGDRYMTPVRIGEPSLPMRNTGARTYFKRNFPADSTVDEFYMYSDKANGQAAALAQWSLGRYYRENDATFVSGAMNIVLGNEASLPAASPIEPPGNGDGVASALQRKARVLGISWTAYNTTLYDYKLNQLKSASIGFTVSPNGGTTWVGAGGLNSGSPTGAAGVTSPAYSPILGADLIGSVVKYAFAMNTGVDPMNTILLESPIVDDVTLYVENKDSLFVEYIVL